MYILLVGLNHKTAPLPIRERFAFTEKEKIRLYKRFSENLGIKSLVILSTCNRTELYAVMEDNLHDESLYTLLLEHSKLSFEEMFKYLYMAKNINAVHHLYRVSAGLDSMILGETQILGQLKSAYDMAVLNNAVDSVIHQLMQKAFSVGKEVRSVTGIDKHPVSVSYTAIDTAKKFCKDFTGKTVVIVGAGQAGKLAATYLKDFGTGSVLITNRSMDKAKKLANELGCLAVSFDLLPTYLKKADVVVSSTAANHLVIHGEQCKKALEERLGEPILLIDIAVPRDIEPSLSKIAGVTLYNMDDFQEIIYSEEKKRKIAADKGEKIVEAELKAFKEWSSSLLVAPVIKVLKKHGEDVINRELKRACNRLNDYGITDREIKVMSDMARAIVNQMLKEPVENLKEFAREDESNTIYIDYTKNLYRNLFIKEGE